MLLVVGAVSSVQAVGCEANEGTPLTDGCLYTITGGDTADPTDGFPIVNTATIPWYTCVSTLDLQDVGYPIAQTFEFDGFQILALQKVMLQYRPDYADTGPCSQFAYLNTMDLLANTYGVNLGGVPAHAVWPQDAGASWAQIVANHLVKANLVGHDSHGIIQTPTYVDRIDAGHIVPGATFDIVKEAPCTAVIDGNWGFGFVQTEKATRLAIEKAKINGVAAVTVYHQSHIGRLGDYPTMMAAEDMIGLITADSVSYTHLTLPTNREV